MELNLNQVFTHAPSERSMGQQMDFFSSSSSSSSSSFQPLSLSAGNLVFRQILNVHHISHISKLTFTFLDSPYCALCFRILPNILYCTIQPRSRLDSDISISTNARYCIMPVLTCWLIQFCNDFQILKWKLHFTHIYVPNICLM